MCSGIVSNEEDLNLSGQCLLRPDLRGEDPVEAGWEAGLHSWLLEDSDLCLAMTVANSLLWRAARQSRWLAS